MSYPPTTTTTGGGGKRKHTPRRNKEGKGIEDGMEIVVISYLLMLNKFDINEKISLLLNIKSILLFSSNNCFLGIFPQTSAQKWLNTKYNIKIFFRFQQMYISKCKNNIIIFSYKFQMTKAAKK